jgi:hypothetical protein
MKKCSVCGVEKELFAFYKRASSPDGLRNNCKACHIAANSTRYYANHEANKEWHRKHHQKKLEANPNWSAEYYAKNKDRLSAYDAEYYRTKNKEKRLAQVKQWVAKNRGRANANKKAYKVAKIQACPPWVREDADLMWMMAEAYELAVMRTDMLGFPWHVDHIVPLRGKKVSGLHTPWNLQVIPGKENMSKSNKFVEVV